MLYIMNLPHKVINVKHTLHIIIEKVISIEGKFHQIIEECLLEQAIDFQLFINLNKYSIMLTLLKRGPADIAFIREVAG